MIKLGSKGAEVRALQHVLFLNIYVDFGEKTYKAVRNYQQERGLIADGVVGLKTWAHLLPELELKDQQQFDHAIFFDNIRSLFGKFSQVQVDNLNILLPLLHKQTTNYVAYMLATAFHETAKTMQPLEEYGKGFGRKYGKRFKQNGEAYAADLPIFYGRGYVQLTWYENYARAGQFLDLDLLHRPELTLTPGIAYQIMEQGMLAGWFTGKKLSDYITLNTADYVGARRIINGKDRAEKIASYACIFETALRRAKA